MPDTKSTTYGLILAAGASSRLGQPKQLLVWQNKTLIEHVIDNARQALGDNIILILGAHSEAIRKVVDLRQVKVIENPGWQEGMASSIRAGINALPKSATAVLFLLCDQPSVDAGHVISLLNAWKNAPNRIVATAYGDSVGVPALFPRAYLPQLLALSGDTGAKSIIMGNRKNYVTIPLAAATLDIDNLPDYRRLQASNTIDKG